MDLVVRELNTKSYKHIRYIHFDLDDGKGFCYRSRVSSGAFFHSCKGRNINGDLRYIERRKEEHEHDLEFWGRMKGAAAMEEILVDTDNKIEEVSVKNIWEFYKLIGYDYKKKRYNK